MSDDPYTRAHIDSLHARITRMTEDHDEAMKGWQADKHRIYEIEALLAELTTKRTAAWQRFLDAKGAASQALWQGKTDTYAAIIARIEALLSKQPVAPTIEERPCLQASSHEAHEWQTRPLGGDWPQLTFVCTGDGAAA